MQELKSGMQEKGSHDRVSLDHWLRTTNFCLEPFASLHSAIYNLKSTKLKGFSFWDILVANSR
jgi:hypothetical protein